MATTGGLEGDISSAVRSAELPGGLQARPDSGRPRRHCAAVPDTR
jgi:hypothetical protein